jgi:hypothetical protein
MASSTARIRQRDRMACSSARSDAARRRCPRAASSNARSVSLLRYRALPLGLGLARVELRIGRVLTGLLLVAGQRLAALDRNLVIGLRARATRNS